MAGIEFRLPGHDRPLASPESYVVGVLRAFATASQALGAATDRLVVRLTGRNAGAPDYQIQTLDGEDAVAFSGESHEPLFDDIARHLEEDELQEQAFSVEQVKDWLNDLHGEGHGGGLVPRVPLKME
jgi:hypothetical protein